MKDDTLRDALLDILVRYGRLTPDLVVHEAHDPASPLHGEFTWDVEEAAQRYWVDQARDLLRRVPVWKRVEERRAVRTPCFVRDPGADPNQQGYVQLSTITPQSEKAAVIIRDELLRMAGAARRAHAIAGQIGSASVIARLAEIERLARTLHSNLHVVPVDTESA